MFVTFFLYPAWVAGAVLRMDDYGMAAIASRPDPARAPATRPGCPSVVHVRVHVDVTRPQSRPAVCACSGRHRAPSGARGAIAPALRVTRVTLGVGWA